MPFKIERGKNTTIFNKNDLNIPFIQYEIFRNIPLNINCSFKTVLSKQLFIHLSLNCYRNLFINLVFFPSTEQIAVKGLINFLRERIPQCKTYNPNNK